jgi:hypothetical protein
MFDILDWGPITSGKFSMLELPALGAPLGWSISQLYSMGVLTATLYVPGDFDRDGVATVADIPAMMSALSNLSGYQSSHGLSGPQLLSIGDLNGTSSVTNADIQALINFLANNRIVIGGGSATSELVPVPEPATCALMAVGAVMLLRVRRAGGSA